MKKAIILFTILFCSFLAPVAHAEESLDAAIESEVSESIGSLDLQEWQQIINELTPEIKSFFTSNDAKTMLYDTALHGFSWNSANISSSITNILKQELWNHMSFLIRIIGVSLLGGIVDALADRGRGGIHQILGFICYCFSVCVAVEAFASCIALGKNTVNKLSEFIQASFPVLLTMLSTSGSSAGSSVIQPAMSWLTGTVAMTIQNVIIPLILVGGVLAVLNSFTGRTQLNQLYKLSKSSAKWILGLMFTLYTGIVTLQGLSVKTLDGLSVRTAKFALDKFVPIVGGMVSGTMDTVLGCAILVKNAVGITAIVLTAALAAEPLIRIGGSIFTYRIAAAICEPVSDARVPKVLANISDVLTYLFAAVTVLCIMFVITAGLIVGMNGALGIGG